MGARFIILHDTILLPLSQQPGKRPYRYDNQFLRLLQRNIWYMPISGGASGLAQQGANKKLHRAQAQSSVTIL